jgi:hypothetical protein
VAPTFETLVAARAKRHTQTVTAGPDRPRDTTCAVDRSRNVGVTTVSGDFELTIDELRVVARYAVEAAEEVLPLFEASQPGDRRPRNAVDAAWTFARGANRTKLQRVTALDAHRAAKDASNDAAKHAARAAGDAAAAAYLHPLAEATQVGHILRAAANAARAAELAADGDTTVGDRGIELALRRATPALVDVLRRYPLAPSGKSRVAQLMKSLDTSLRSL